MKMHKEHFEVIFLKLKELSPAIEKTREAIRESGKYNDLEKCLRWTLFHYVVPSNWVCDNLYPYLNDDHIDSALRSLMRKLEGVKYDAQG